jgi:hypothetical protein
MNSMRLDRSLLLVLPFAVVALGASSCGLYHEMTAADRLRLARQLWELNGYEDYRYLLEFGCFCGPGFTAPVLVTVRNGVVVDARIDSSQYQRVDTAIVRDWKTGRMDTLVRDRRDELVGIAPDPSHYRTIPQLMAEVGYWLEGPWHTVRLNHDPEHGYPRRFWIDFDKHVVDEEFGFSISRFEPLE